ncbi:hypothetical protein [Paenibacillus albiflavus]|uniref:hypothetical protein n=1 Tax=Paenibacillus albiflavus TaxID=2545760 RepID=UPI001F3BAF70|nr:hypothetical protein [Paenibacillus albiflavus]
MNKDGGFIVNMIISLIIACEVAFWIVIALGLICRYMLNRDKLGVFFLALTPVVDLILLVATSIDLYNGATATTAHGIAAVYIGVSIGFGKSMINWADEKFRYYVLKQGDKPARKYGIEHAMHYMKSFIRHIAAFVIGAGLLLAMIYFIDNPTRTEALLGILKIWSVALGVDLIITVSYFLWPRKA